ncbi:MAG TPA: alpha/beta fold hydrolase [Rhodobacteraceae bacterium]|nr:alpha/beta fold hydrolase [Paracoccaceae bacterium]
MLNAVEMGEGEVPLVIVHGLFGSARNWRVLQKRLAESRRVIAVDLRNHGDSFWRDENSYEALAGDLAEVIDAQGGVADVLGHSMGGKAAMVLSLTRPEMLRRLIVADIAPVAYAHTQARHIAAMQAVDMSVVTRRSEADKQLAGQVAEAPLRAFFLQSVELGESGARWKLNLEALAAEMPRIMGFPELGNTFDGPVLMLSGAGSDYVKPELHPEILRLFPQAEFEVIAGAGHWLHAEKPREFQAAVAAFLG